MSQNSVVLPTTGTVSGLQMTQNTNNALDTLNTLWAGASAPASPEAGQWWHDTTNNILKMRSLDNTTWIPITKINESSYYSQPYASQAIGTSTNDNAVAGNIGEYIYASVAQSAPISILNNTPINIVSISLTAGDWNVWGNAGFLPAGSTVFTAAQVGISTTSATQPVSPAGGFAQWVGTVTGNGPVIDSGVTRVTLGSTTTLYCVGTAFFNTSTCTVYGFIGARRAR